MSQVLTDEEVFGTPKRGSVLTDAEVFGQSAPPSAIGRAAFSDTLREELKNADWGTRNIAAFGTALSDLYERGKQLVGRGDRDAIEANKIIQDEAPVGAAVGKLAVSAAPFALAGNSIRAAAAVGGGLGFAEPVAGEQTLGNIAKGTAANTASGAILSALGQAGANKVGDYLTRKAAGYALENAQMAPLQATINQSLDAGLVIPPSSVRPSFANKTKEAIAGKIATAQEFSNKNAAVLADLVRRDLGLAPDEPLTLEAMRAIRSRAFNEGYMPVASSGRVTTGDDYAKALDNIVEKYRGPAQDFPGAADDSVIKFVEGAKKVKVPAREEWRDGAGRVLEDVVEPKMPKFRNLLDELKRNGGISTAELGDLGEQYVHKSYPGLLRKKGGNSADGFTEWMVSNGWITEDAARMADDSMPGGAHELARDMIRAALNREPVIHPAQYDRWASFSDEAQNFVRAGIEKVKIPEAEYGGLRVPSFDAGNALKMSQNLRNEASDAWKAGNSGLAKAKREAANAIEDQVERHIAGMKDEKQAAEMLRKFREARQLMAKSHDVEKSIIPGSGSIDARKLVPAAKKGKLTGGLKVAGEFAANFPKAAQPPAQIAGPGVSALRAAAGLMMGAGGAMTGAHPVVSAGVAAYPLIVPNVMRKHLASRSSQNALREALQLGLAERMAGRLIENAPVAGAVLGPNALAQYLALEP